MLPKNIRKHAEYLSAHFEDKTCREELRELIHNYIKHKHKTYEK